MTDHDALCPRADIGYLPNVACWCDEIAKVRADERGRVLREAREAIYESDHGDELIVIKRLIDDATQEAP